MVIVHFFYGGATSARSKWRRRLFSEHNPYYTNEFGEASRRIFTDVWKPVYAFWEEMSYKDIMEATNINRFKGTQA
jgi:hypothetical protein